MGTSLTPASREDVVAVIARAMRGAAPSVQTVGDAHLFPHQRDAVRRARQAIARFGGALLADDVGSGKTFVALAIAAQYARPVVIAPASLRHMWSHATARTTQTIPFVSAESLGRGPPQPGDHDLVIIDEAHHFRNPSTQRYATAQEFVRSAHVLLASATPVHNVASDLDALLALFLHEDAADVSDETRAAIVIRSSGVQRGPSVLVHEPLTVSDDARVLDAIRALPPPARAHDSGDAPALLHIALMRAWCSSVAALDAMLTRALHATAALRDALDVGRSLSRAELRSWSTGDNGQLAFAELLGAACGNGVDVRHAIGIAERHAEAVDALRTTIRAQSIDDLRVAHIESIRARHPTLPVLACAHYAATVNALWSRLRHRPGVCMLTSHGARIASGAISRDEALALFAPIAHGAATPHARERITLLLATDLVSEGLNLQDAGVVVHLDVPWTAARLAQRVGRVARIGSPHSIVHSYSIAAPRAAEALLELERRVRDKRELGERLVGGARQMAALLGRSAPRSARVGPSPAEAQAEIQRLLQTTDDADGHGTRGYGNDETALVCGVEGKGFGWLALLTSPQPRLVAKLGSSPATADPRPVAVAVHQLVNGTPLDTTPDHARALAQVTRWIGAERARELAGAGRANAVRMRGHVARATAGAVNAAPAHERANAAVRAHEEMAAFRSRTAPENQSAIVRAIVLFSARDRTPHRNSV